MSAQTKKEPKGMKYNALKHGLFTKEALLPFENRRDYLRFRRNVINSLNPTNDLERHLASDIADDAWRVRRHDEQIYAQRQKIYDRLTPKMVAQVAGIPEEFDNSLPDWLTDMAHVIKKSMANFSQKVCDEYLDCHKNFASIPNLAAVYTKYPRLFECADVLAAKLGHPAVRNTPSNCLAAVWQTSTPQLWKLLKQVYHNAYFMAYWKAIRQTALPWVESWYFLQESESSRLEHLKSLGIKVRADFRKQLQAYERLKKCQVILSPTLSKLASVPQDTGSSITATKSA
jgi:hypothetical protein